MNTKHLLLWVLLLTSCAGAADLPLVPSPQAWVPSGGDLSAAEFQTLTRTDRRVPDLPPEGYRLRIVPDGLTVEAADDAGAYYAGATLAMLADLPGGRVPCGLITDFPRYRWRGMLLDCGRHFMPVDLIKTVIDQLAALKFNVLHWHLTEDQGWRLEIPAYPRLTEVGAWRINPDGTRYGGFYTLDDAREVVAYAAARHITVVPEIEMPGHSVAALAAYPELSCTGGPIEVENQWGIHKDVYCAGNDDTFTFLETVLDQVLEVFPSEYIHIGGDECPKERWKNCAKCQARITAEGLENEHELQSWFIQRAEAFLNSRGRKLIGWDEILEGGLAPSATVQSWRGFKGGIAAAQAGHDAIMSPTQHCYFDYDVATLPLHKVFTFVPVPREISADQARHILGGEMNLWTEYIPPAELTRKVFPRALAMAECLWTGPERRDFAEFLARMRVQRARLLAAGISVGPNARPVGIQPKLDNGRLHLTPRVDEALVEVLPHSQLEIRGRTFRVGAYDPNLKSERQPVAPLTRRDPLTEGKHPASAEGHQVHALQLFVDDMPYGAPTLIEQQGHLAVGRPVTFAKPPSGRYPGGGDLGLVNGLHGGQNFRDGLWSGFEGTDLDAVIDLGADTPLTEISVRFYQGTTAWIFLPQTVEFQVSADGQSWTPLAVAGHEVSHRLQNRLIRTFSAEAAGHRARFVRVVGRSLRLCPDGHPGAGQACWVFADEVVVR